MKKKKTYYILLLVCLFIFVPDVSARTIEFAKCGNIDSIPKSFINITRIIIDLIKYGTILLLVINGMLDFFKGIKAGEDQNIIKKSGKNFLKRLLIAGIVLIIFPLIQFSISLIANDSNASGCLSCFLGNESSCTYFSKEVSDDVGSLPEPPDPIPNEQIHGGSTTEHSSSSGESGGNYDDTPTNKTGYETAAIVSMDVSAATIGCPVKYGEYTLNTLQINSTIKSQMTTILKEVCSYIKSNTNIYPKEIRTAGTYNPNNSYPYPHGYAMGIDLFSDWKYTYNGSTYYPYSSYANSSNYRKFICGVCGGKENCQQNINYQIYEKIFKPKGWCWGGYWGESNFDPMHYEVMHYSSCSTGNHLTYSC